MAGKQTPRQKMIAMMYLVLTVLLALNISKDVLDAFVVVDENIEQSNRIFEKKMQEIYKDFESNYLINPQKVKPFWTKAKEAQLLSNEMHTYIQKVRSELVAKAEGVSIDSAKFIVTKKISVKDENTMCTNYFLGNTDDGSQGEARKLKIKINEYRKNILKLIDPQFYSSVNLGLKTNGKYYNADEKEESWETHFFYNTVIVADIALLSKINLDVYNAEFEVVNYLYKSIGQGDFKFEKIEAKVVPKSNFVFIGEEYTAEIIVAAYDTSQSPEVYYSTGIDYLSASQYESATLLENKPGKIKITFPAKTEGIKRFAGIVRTKSSSGVEQDYHFKSEFIVAKPSNIISAKKMNVFYIGVDNPVSIIISGIPSENLLFTITNGVLKRDLLSDDWIVNVPANISKTVITIFTSINGVKKKVGSKLFRVKKLPNPVPTIANKNSGTINREIIIAAGAIVPKMPDDFDFDHSFIIKSFTLTIQRGFKTYHYKSTGPYLSNEMTAQIKRTNRGQNIVFEDIVATDSNSIDRDLSSIILKIK